MADIIQTLKLESDPTTNVFPNIKEGNIPSNAVTEDKINNGAVTSGKLASDAVTESKILNGSVTTNKIASNAVTEDKIAPTSVTAGKIATGAVTTSKILNESVTGDKIIGGAITYGKLMLVQDRALSVIARTLSKTEVNLTYDDIEGVLTDPINNRIVAIYQIYGHSNGFTNVTYDYYNDGVASSFTFYDGSGNQVGTFNANDLTGFKNFLYEVWWDFIDF